MANSNYSDFKEIVRDIDDRKILLPDFQRDFVWKDEERQKKIVASVLTKMPIGSILLLTSSADEYCSKIIGRNADLNTSDITGDVDFLLDGQQRITVLTNVFSNVIHDKCPRVSELVSPSLKRRFFLKIPKWIDVHNGKEADLFGIQTLRRFKEEDAQEVRNLIVRNFLEVNSKDYGISAMEKLAKAYDAEKVLNVASYAHMYVFEFDGKIIGTGSISSFWGSETESILLSIFVLPEFHGKGVGRKIINILETDEFYVRASRIEIPASITATEFYRKFGYDYKNGVKELDNEHHYRLEKFKEAGLK